jgi:hypothetical protein
MDMLNKGKRDGVIKKVLLKINIYTPTKVKHHPIYLSIILRKQGGCN